MGRGIADFLKLDIDCPKFGRDSPKLRCNSPKLDVNCPKYGCDSLKLSHLRSEFLMYYRICYL